MHKQVTTKHKKNAFLQISIAVMIFISAFMPSDVGAVSSTSFPATGRGYFTDRPTSFSAAVLSDSVTDGSSDSVPTCVNNKEELISYIRALHYGSRSFVCDGRSKAISPTTRDNVGSNFIIQTMRSDGVSYDRNPPSDADVNDWADKVRNYPGSISWNMSKASAGINNNTMNTSYGSNTNDITWHNSSGTSSPNGVIVFSYNGITDYMIKRNCGNPMGALRGVKTNNYSLSPGVNLSSSSVVSVDEEVRFTPYVNNSGNSSSGSTTWEINVLNVPSGTTIPRSSGGNSSSVPCTFYSSPGVGCSQPTLKNGLYSTSSSNFPVGIKNFDPRAFDVPDVPAGTRLCITLSLNPRSNKSSEWTHSAPICMVIGSKPKVQVLGGDLRVQGAVDTGITIKSGLSYGSWVEYGVFSVGSVSGLASGSALSSVPNNGVSGSNSCNRSYLTFSNAVTAACSGNSPIGGYNSLGSLPSVAASFVVSSGTPTINTAGVSNNSNVGLFRATSPLAINSANIPKGRWLVINAKDTNVNINGNIVYDDGPFADISEIPQVVIIARNINIAGGVGRVDAWLIASNSINTCSERAPGSRLTISDCNQQLQVNGPVVSNHLYLQRTAGSGTGTDSGTPAEIFNIRPDSYLWAYNQSKTTNLIRTVYTTALPPRL